MAANVSQHPAVLAGCSWELQEQRHKPGKFLHPFAVRAWSILQREEEADVQVTSWLPYRVCQQSRSGGYLQASPGSPLSPHAPGSWEELGDCGGSQAW